MRLISLMATPVVVLSFAIPTVVCYYARVNMIFTYLIDALLYISLCGFVMFSYMPCAKAKPICDEKWKEYDRQVDIMNGKAVDEENSEDFSDSENDEEPKTEDSIEKTDTNANSDTENDTDPAGVKNSEDENENTEEL